ncbi:unnamed protein product [Agarophyton chilense]
MIFSLLSLCVMLLSSSLTCAQPIYWKIPCLAQLPLTCHFIPTAGNNVTGTVFFTPFFNQKATTENRCFVRITANISGLSQGPHGFHIHTYGDIQSHDGASTGGHFSDPSGSDRKHALPGEYPRHWGDFGSVVATANGTASYDRVDYTIKLRGITGRGMIVHALEDMGSGAQPSGAAGPRQARCVIGFANPGYIPPSLFH